MPFATTLDVRYQNETLAWVRGVTPVVQSLNPPTAEPTLTPLVNMLAVLAPSSCVGVAVSRRIVKLSNAFQKVGVIVPSWNPGFGTRFAAPAGDASPSARA